MLACQGLSCSWLASVVDLADAESRALDVRFLALRAASGACKTLSIFKFIAAGQTVSRCNNVLLALR